MNQRMYWAVECSYCRRLIPVQQIQPETSQTILQPRWSSRSVTLKCHACGISDEYSRENIARALVDISRDTSIQEFPLAD
jgi:hypothetical protein